MSADARQRTRAARGPRANAREDILGAAEEVVAALGAQSLTLDAVYRQAGISKGGLLYHFPSKEALIDAMVERHVARLQAQEAALRGALGNGPGADVRAGIAQVAADAPGADRLGAALLAAVANDLDRLAPVRAMLRDRYEAMKRSSVGFETAAIVDLATSGLMLMELLRLAPLSPDDRRRVLAALDRMAGGDGALPEAGSCPSSPLVPTGGGRTV